MLPTSNGSLRLFRFSGISVFLHWSWFVVAIFEFRNRADVYSSMLWNVLEYLTLFGIVLLHEFGHALACRQTGGKADTILLWPLGGVALISPPQRAGAMLWSVAAGPLVNVVLAAPLSFLYFTAGSTGLFETLPNLFAFIRATWWINIGLLIFNLLPAYPLDGGQILRSLLWFFVGPARSLMIVTIIGFAGVAALLALAFASKSIWLGIMALFMLFTCWRGFSHARALHRIATLPRRQGFACPQCRQPPIIGPVWVCHKCAQRFDTFEVQAQCPNCGEASGMTQCIDCGGTFPFPEWSMAVPRR